MRKKHYIALTQTVDQSSGMVYVVGLLGVFHNLKKALNVCNREIEHMNAPDYYTLLPFRRTSGFIPVDEHGNYSKNSEDYGIVISVIVAESNHIYNREEIL